MIKELILEREYELVKHFLKEHSVLLSEPVKKGDQIILGEGHLL
jgi:hypothetical protein